MHASLVVDGRYGVMVEGRHVDPAIIEEPATQRAYTARTSMTTELKGMYQQPRLDLEART